MLDIKFVRENKDVVKKGVAAKQLDPTLVDKVLTLDEKRRELIGQIEDLRKQRNEVSREATDTGRQRGKEIKEKLKEFEPTLKETEELYKEALNQLPNPPAVDVKTGKNDTENDVLRTWGKPREFDFPVKDHLALGEALGIIDVERAAKVSGSRFGYLKGDGVRLEFALVQFALERLSKEGFVPVVPPVLIQRQAMQKMGYIEHGGEGDMYVLDKDDLVLVGTSEQSIGPMHMNETLDAKALPLRYMGFSTCFRREAGSYGKDTRGILRVHQFDKVEMFSFIQPEAGDAEHEFLREVEEKFLQALELPYQVVKMCSGDLGAPAARKYDLEAWMPGQEKYREVTSTSTTTDFQSRRLNIKYRDGQTVDYLHMLNGTAFAVGRMIIAILENYQNADGSITIPVVLRKFMGKDTLI